MTTSAATPSFWVSAESSNSTPEPALAQRQAERQVQQQAGEADPVGQPEGDRRHQDHDGADGKGDGDIRVHRGPAMGGVSRMPMSFAPVSRCRAGPASG